MNDITDSMDMSLRKLREIVKEQGGLVCCSSRGHKESDSTEQLNGTEELYVLFLACVSGCVYSFSLINLFIEV